MMAGASKSEETLHIDGRFTLLGGEKIMQTMLSLLSSN